MIHIIDFPTSALEYLAIIIIIIITIAITISISIIIIVKDIKVCVSVGPTP